jgi:hypothetical protein
VGVEVDVHGRRPRRARSLVAAPAMHGVLPCDCGVAILGAGAGLREVLVAFGDEVGRAPRVTELLARPLGAAEAE